MKHSRVISGEPDFFPTQSATENPMKFMPWPRLKLRGNALVLSAVTLVSLARDADAAIPSPEKLLPNDTLIVVTIPDFAKMRDIYKSSPQTRLWNDPAMKPFRDRFMSRLNDDLVSPLERELGVHFDDYTGLLQGQLTFAMTQDDWQGSNDRPPAFLFLLDARDKSGQLKKNLAELRKKWVESGRSVQTQKIRDVDFSIVPLTSNAVPRTLQKFFPPNGDSIDGGSDTGKEAAKGQLIIGQCDSLLILGNSTRAIEKVVVHLTGGSMPSLGDQAAYEANRLALFRDAPLYGWVNTRAFLDLMYRKSPDKGPDQDPLAMLDPEKIINATGLGGVKALAFSFKTSSDGSMFQMFLSLPESSRQGLFKLLPGQGKEAGPPPFVPADAVKFQRTRIDGQKAWATLQTVLNDISPQLLSGLNFLLDNANAAAREKDPGFDIKKNLFGNLGDDLISYQKVPHDSSPQSLRSPPALFLIGSPQAEQLAMALKSVLVLMTQQAGSPQEREFLGRKIYSVPLPAVPVAASDTTKTPPRNLSYAASGGYLALTTEASILEEYLRSSESQQKELRETPGLAEATAKVGGASQGCFGYENQAETSRYLIEALRKNAGTNRTNTVAALPGGMGFPGAPNPFKDWVDFSLLPPFEQIAKYFSFTVYSAGANADGFTFRMFAPVPPQLKK